MEAFKYVTQKHLEIIKRDGALLPRISDSTTYAIPEDPDLWGEGINEVFDHLMKSGISPVVLLKFILDEDDPDVGVQEGGDAFLWDKPGTRVWIRDYAREDFKLPEVVIFRPIPLEEISILDSISVMIERRDANVIIDHCEWILKLL